MQPITEETSPTRVMIVEDEGIIARDVRRILTRLGYEVVGHASSGAEALETLGMVRADIALMDIKIKGDLDGIQTAALAWQRFRLPVVFLTAHADRTTLRRATETAPFGYVVKPFTEASLQVALEVAIARHRLQRVSDDQQTRLNTALQSLADAVIVTDFDGRIDFLNQNAEEFLGWSSVDAHGKALDHVAPITGMDGSDVGDWIYGVAPPEPTLCQAVSLEGRRGSKIPVLASVTPLKRPGSEETRGTVLMLRPLPPVAPPAEPVPTNTEQRLKELSFVLTHDLREPVRNIGCFAQMLERRELEGLDADSREYLRYIIDGSRKMDGLLLGLHRYQYASDFQRKPQAFASADEAVGRALNHLRAEIRRTNATITTAALPSVDCEPAVLTELFEILLANALRFRSNSDPEIRINAALHEGGQVMFRLRDNGIGLASDQFERVFEPFKKAHDQSRSGAGIGLAIARRFVEVYGGKIWLEANPDSGITAAFTLAAANA